jgi:hypothetical protein
MKTDYDQPGKKRATDEICYLPRYIAFFYY